MYITAFSATVDAGLDGVNGATKSKSLSSLPMPPSTADPPGAHFSLQNPVLHPTVPHSGTVPLKYILEKQPRTRAERTIASTLCLKTHIPSAAFAFLRSAC